MGKDYTIRCAWDAVLKEGEASKKTQKMREMKAKKKLEDKERAGKIEYTEISKEVIIWEGTVYEPRGMRRIKQAKKNGKNYCLIYPLPINKHFTIPILNDFAFDFCIIQIDVCIICHLQYQKN